MFFLEGIRSNLNHQATSGAYPGLKALTQGLTHSPRTRWPLRNHDGNKFDTYWKVADDAQKPM